MLKKQIFGLDISDHSLEAVILKKPTFGTPQVQSYSRTILRGEVVKNGVIKNSKKLEENIAKLLQSASPRAITSPYCILSIPESQVFSTIFKMPIGLKRGEIQKTISYKAEEVIPFKSSEIYYDFKTIASDGDSQEVYYVAVPIKIVDSYIQALKNIGLKPIAFDLESSSLARALINKKSKSTEGKLLIDIGSRTTNLNIFDRNGIRQSLTIKIGGNRFTKAISTKFGISLKEADLLKMKDGFNSAGKQKGKILLVLQNEFKRIVSESKNAIEFYESETKRKVNSVILVGGSALLPKIDQYLADNLGIEVNLGNPFDPVRPGKFDKLKKQSVLFSNVIGLALRGLSKDPSSGDINLLPFEASKFAIAPSATQHGAWKKIRIMSIIFIVLIIGLAWLYQYKAITKDVWMVDINNKEISSDIDLEYLDKFRLESLMEEPTTTPTSTQPIFIVTINQTVTGSLNVRSEASTNSEKVGEVLSGDQFTLLEEVEGWYQIEYSEGLNGWVSADFSEVDEQAIVDGEELNDIETEANEGVLEDESVLNDTEEILFSVEVSDNEVGYLTVRSGPGTVNNRLGQLDLGSLHDVYEEVSGWYRIKFNDEDGWISSVYVDKL